MHPKYTPHTKLVAATAAATLSAAATLNPQNRRGAAFWIKVVPILAPYLAFQLATLPLDENQRHLKIQSLHQKQAKKALKLVQQLQGGYIKMGQVLSNRADSLPLAYVRAFSVLQDNANPRAWHRMEPILKGTQLRNQLADVELEPIGAASTGQVHAGTLRCGRRVAIKITYPEARRQFRADFTNVMRLMRFTIPALVPVVKTVRRRFENEFDYEKEAFHQSEIRRRLMANPKFARRIVVPRPYPELGSSRVLVMELIQGEKLTRNYERRARALLGDRAFDYASRRALHDLQAAGFTQLNPQVHLLAVPQIIWLRFVTRRRMKLLLRVSAYQIFESGLFNAGKACPFFFPIIFSLHPID